MGVHKQNLMTELLALPIIGLAFVVIWFVLQTRHENAEIDADLKADKAAQLDQVSTHVHSVSDASIIAQPLPGPR